MFSQFLRRGGNNKGEEGGGSTNTATPLIVRRGEEESNVLLGNCSPGEKTMEKSKDPVFQTTGPEHEDQGGGS